jgi:HD-GYP domain-containing protein (c-di-GMP phosphodiesterase class II)
MAVGVAPYRRLVASLFGTLKLMQMYGRGNDATSDAINNLCEAVRESAGIEEDAVVQVRGRRLQVNGRTMRASECGTLALTYLADEWSKRGIASVDFRVDVGADDLATFGEVLLAIDPEDEDPVGTLTSALAGRGVGSIAVERLNEEDLDPVVQEERRDTTMRTYIRGLRAFKEVLRADGYPNRTKVRRARRAVQGLVDRFTEDEAAVLTLAQIHSHDRKLFHHCMNVCIYALVIGQRIGMSRRQLGELGLAALFHDLGKTAEVEAQAAETDEDARRRSERKHPVRGARMLLAESHGHTGMLKAAVATFEQHSHFDLSGFPPVEHELHIFSRIITIADCYDALTSQRAGEDKRNSSYEAFRVMQTRAGTIFDPILLKVFVNATGVYPAGSLLRLSSGEVAIVVAGPEDPEDFDRPRARVVDQSRGVLPPGTEVDLAERDDGGKLARDIVGTLAAHEVFATVGDLVAAV